MGLIPVPGKLETANADHGARMEVSWTVPAGQWATFVEVNGPTAPLLLDGHGHDEFR